MEKDFDYYANMGVQDDAEENVEKDFDYYANMNSQEDANIEVANVKDFDYYANMGTPPVEKNPLDKQAIYYDEIDPSTQKIQAERGEMWYANKAMFDRSNAEYQKKLVEYQKVNEMKPFMQDALLMEKAIGTKPVLHRREQIPQVVDDVVQPQAVEEQFSQLAEQTGLETDIPSIPQQSVGDVRKEQMLEMGTQEYVKQYNEEEKRKTEEEEGKSKLASLGAGIVGGVHVITNSLNNLSAATRATLGQGGDVPWSVRFDNLKEHGVFNEIEEGLGIKFSKEFYEKRADNSLMGQVIKGLGTGMVDVLTLKATAALGMLNFPVHSALKSLDRGDFENLGEIGKAMTIGGAEGLMMDRILHVAPKLFPKTKLNVGKFKIPVPFNQQIGTGLASVAGAELTHGVLHPEQEMTMDDRFANFWTMALMAGKARGKTTEVMSNKRFKGSKTHSKMHNTFTDRMEKAWEGKQTPEKIQKHKDFQADMNRQMEYMKGFGEYKRNKMRYLDKNPSVKKKMQVDIYNAYEKVNIKLKPYEVQQNIELMAIHWRGHL